MMECWKGGIMEKPGARPVGTVATPPESPIRVHLCHHAGPRGKSVVHLSES